MFAIFVSKASALVWQAKNNKEGKVVLRRPKSWALVNHYHFHIIDPEWGHVTMRMSGHPPLGVLISLNGHEWVKRQAQKQGILWVKQSKCFVGGSDLAKINGVAERLDGKQGLARLGEVVDRWIYWACLCFALKLEQQKRSEFRYAYSCYQLEYSRNLLFKSGRQLDEIYQGLIDRTRRVLEVPRLKTIFGCKNRPSRTRKHDGQCYQFPNHLRRPRKFSTIVVRSSEIVLIAVLLLSIVISGEARNLSWIPRFGAT